MKKFIKGRWFPLIVAILVLLVAGMVMFLLGWRITYAPKLENDWDAISAVAAWAGVIGAVSAVFSAIYVANQQNKIALFEKRMECYSTLQNIFAFARQISNVESNRAVHAAFKLYFGGPDFFPQNQSYAWYAITLKRQEPIIVGGHFLFSEYNEEKPQDVLMQIIELARLVAVRNKEEAEQPISDSAKECRADIFALCCALEENLIPLMEKDLQL